MSMSNATENQTLKMHLQGTDPAYRAGATQYLAPFSADPGETGSLAAEATYTGYARVALTKATAWTDGGSSFSNANLIQFGACTAGTTAATHFAVVDTVSGAVSVSSSKQTPPGRKSLPGCSRFPATLVGCVIPIWYGAP